MLCLSSRRALCFYRPGPSVRREWLTFGKLQERCFQNQSRELHQLGSPRSSRKHHVAGLPPCAGFEMHPSEAPTPSRYPLAARGWRAPAAAAHSRNERAEGRACNCKHLIQHATCVPLAAQPSSHGAALSRSMRHLAVVHNRVSQGPDRQSHAPADGPRGPPGARDPTGTRGTDSGHRVAVLVHDYWLLPGALFGNIIISEICGGGFQCLSFGGI